MSDTEQTRVQETSNGTIVRASNGKFLPGTKPNNTFTPDNARQMRARAQEIAAQRIRKEIASRHGPGVLPSQAVAIAAGDLWEQIVINKDANPRYRTDAWLAIGRQAQLLGDARDNSAQDGISINIPADVAREMVQQIMERRAKESKE